MNNKLCNNLFNLTRKKIKKVHTIISFVLIFSLCTGVVQAFADSGHIVRLKMNDKWYVYNTMEDTVEDFLKKEEISLNKKDIIDVSLDKKITEDIYININRAEELTFIIDGKKEIKYITNEMVLGKVLNLFNNEQKRKYYLNEGQSSAEVVYDGMKISVSSYIDRIETIKETVPFGTKTIKNPNMYEGEKNIKTKGINGTKEIRVKKTYKKDEVIDTKVLSMNTTKQAINQIIEIGTKKKEYDTNTIKTEKGVFKYKNMIPMKSTAYTAGLESTGKTQGQKGYGITASGMKARKGVVAVDTRIIPFGTKLYIEGYGYAVAGDTGGSIKGNKVDVFLDSYSDAIKYGVRNVKVYILGEKVA